MAHCHSVFFDPEWVRRDADHGAGEHRDSEPEELPRIGRAGESGKNLRPCGNSHAGTDQGAPNRLTGHNISVRSARNRSQCPVRVKLSPERKAFLNSRRIEPTACRDRGRTGPCGPGCSAACCDHHDARRLTRAIAPVAPFADLGAARASGAAESGQRHPGGARPDRFDTASGVRCETAMADVECRVVGPRAQRNRTFRRYRKSHTVRVDPAVPRAARRIERP